MIPRHHRHRPIGTHEIPGQSTLLLGQPASRSNSASCVATTRRQRANVPLSRLEPYGVPLMASRSARCLRRTVMVLLVLVIA